MLWSPAPAEERCGCYDAELPPSMGTASGQGDRGLGLHVAGSAQQQWNQSGAGPRHSTRHPRPAGISGWKAE